MIELGQTLGILAAALCVAAGLARIGDALFAISMELSIINTHGLHLRNYPRDTFKIEGRDQ